MKSVLEISRAAVESNIRAIRQAAGDAVELLAVLKADAYGHTAAAMAPLVAAAGVRWIGVTDAAEGAAVRSRLQGAAGGRDVRLMVMLGPEPEDAAAIVAHRLTPVIWTAAQIAPLEQAAEAAGSRLPVHLEVDTGMARQGATPGAELAATLEALAAAPHLELDGLLTHLISSEAAGSPLTTVQRTRFAAALREVCDAGLRPRWLHMGNSSAVDAGDTMSFIRRAAADAGANPMVRCGYALFGYAMPLVTPPGSSGTPGAPGSSATPALRPELAPVLTWKTRILALRDLAAGASVGYGATFVAPAAMRVALLPVGYSDGFRRAASSGMGNGWVMVAGRRAPVLGRVSMNHTVVDVTGLDGVRAGEEVVLLGPGVTAEDHAGWAGTIGYEILCGLRGNVHVR